MCASEAASEMSHHSISSPQSNMTGHKIEKNAQKWIFQGRSLTKIKNGRSNSKDSSLTFLLDIDQQVISQVIFFFHQFKLYSLGKIKHALVLQKEKNMFSLKVCPHLDFYTFNATAWTECMLSCETICYLRSEFIQQKAQLENTSLQERKKKVLDTKKNPQKTISSCGSAA